MQGDPAHSLCKKFPIFIYPIFKLIQSFSYVSAFSLLLFNVTYYRTVPLVYNKKQSKEKRGAKDWGETHMNVLEDKLKQKDIQQFRDDLISWFEREQRVLPWREDQDPYKVWVSEVMLSKRE